MLHVQEVIFEDAVVLRATSSASPLQKQNPFKPKNEDPDKCPEWVWKTKSVMWQELFQNVQKAREGR